MQNTQDFLKKIIQQHPVVLFMKGSPSFPQCGFSQQAVQILQHLDVTFHAIDVLEDDSIRQGIKDYSDWPTIPQLYVNKTFIGGCDIIKDMFASGELQNLISPLRTESPSE